MSDNSITHSTLIAGHEFKPSTLGGRMLETVEEIMRSGEVDRGVMDTLAGEFRRLRPASAEGILLSMLCNALSHASRVTGGVLRE
jgi:hypothetical protein